MLLSGWVHLALLIFLLLAFLDVFRNGIKVSGGDVNVVCLKIDGCAAFP